MGEPPDETVMWSTLRSALSTDELELLEMASPGLTDVLDRPVDALTSEDLNELRQQVTDLLAASGFDADYGVNALGRRCEDLIDRLAPWHWGKDPDLGSA